MERRPRGSGEGAGSESVQPLHSTVQLPGALLHPAVGHRPWVIRVANWNSSGSTAHMWTLNRRWLDGAGLHFLCPSQVGWERTVLPRNTEPGEQPGPGTPGAAPAHVLRPVTHCWILASEA